MHGPDFQAINSSIHQAVAPPPSSRLPKNLPLYLLYALQVVDAKKSAQLFRQPGTFEVDPIMRPFSHGGMATMMLGFGLTDIIRGMLMRRASPGKKNAAALMQAASNAYGIEQTQHDINRIKAEQRPPVHHHVRRLDFR